MKTIKAIKSLFYAIVGVCIIYLTYGVYTLNNSKEFFGKLESNIEIYSKLDPEKYADMRALEFLEVAKDTTQTQDIRRALYASALFKANNKDLILPAFLDFYNTEIESLVNDKKLEEALDLYTELIDSKDFALQSGTLENILNHSKYDEKIQTLYDSYILSIQSSLENDPVMAFGGTKAEISTSIANEIAILNKLKSDEDRLLLAFQFKQNVDAIKMSILANGDILPAYIVEYSKSLEGVIEALVKAKQNQESNDYKVQHKKYQRLALTESRRLEETIKANDASNIYDAAERAELLNIYAVARDFFKIDSRYLDPAVNNIYIEAFNKLWKRCDAVKVELSGIEIEAEKLSPKDL